MKNYCCFIGCQKDATKHIQYDGVNEGIANYESYTHSCDEHVENLSEGLKDVEIMELGVDNV